MRITGFLLVIILFIYSPVTVYSQARIVYTCPMHPEIQQPGPGKCPKCGMTLVKKTIRSAPVKQPPKKQPAKINPPVKAVPVPKPDSSEKKDSILKPDEPGDEIKFVPASVNVVRGKTVRYDLYVKDSMVNFTGKKRRAIAINGSIPAPELVFTEGDTAEIYLHNQLNEETSLHWHGVILPNQADGVPLLTTKKIGPGESHLYKFRVVQNGTYWYHSHSALQEQSGMYGALIFKPHKEAEEKLYDKEYTLVLSEWTDDNPLQVQRRLRTANDWFAIQKGSVQSYAEAIKEGHFTTKFVNEWKRMKAMDVSDVYYERFLANGSQVNTVPGIEENERVKLRIVNAGASTYFWLGYPVKMTVTGNDGNDVAPVEVDRLIIAPAETYDVIVTVPSAHSYEFRATPEDRTGATSLWLGSGLKIPAPVLPRLNYFEGMKMMNDMMHTDGTMDDMGMKMSNQEMDMNTVMYPELMDTDGSDITVLNYGMLKSPVITKLPIEKLKTLHFTLTGNMNRYVWTLDNKTVKEADRIMIEKGEVLKLIVSNNSMMRHPMHLHGHDFRVVNRHGDFAPLKNVIDIMPMETDTIEFAANQNGNWFFHCHILFHMMAGMGRVFTYTNSTVNPELPDVEKAFREFRRHKDQNMMHLMARAGIETNGTEGEIMLSTNRSALKGMWHVGYNAHHGYESELLYGRYLGVNQWIFPYIGFDYHYKMEDGDKTNSSDYRNFFGQGNNKNDRKVFVAGIEYTLPWLVLADARVDHEGKFRFQLSREDIPVSRRMRINFAVNTDKEYTAGLRYIVSKWMALSTHYDSDMKAGVGITLTY
jgi:FtsP/CotA-like multicopper oxidase with cupredoxin domain